VYCPYCKPLSREQQQYLTQLYFPSSLPTRHIRFFSLPYIRCIYLPLSPRSKRLSHDSRTFAPRALPPSSAAGAAPNCPFASVSNPPLTNARHRALIGPWRHDAILSQLFLFLFLLRVIHSSCHFVIFITTIATLAILISDGCLLVLKPRHCHWEEVSLFHKTSDDQHIVRSKVVQSLGTYSVQCTQSCTLYVCIPNSLALTRTHGRTQYTWSFLLSLSFQHAFSFFLSYQICISV
jgi:hypothetical protein